jgi:predicted DNA-binding protein (UPF0251 family)
MSSSELYAVLTGDIVGSKKIIGSQRDNLLDALKLSFSVVEDIFPNVIHAPFEIHRGDSFQGTLSSPELALRVAVVIRAGLRVHFKAKTGPNGIDARIAMGIGTIDFLPTGRVSEGDGDAFRRSGPLLDMMKKKRRLMVQTPWQDIDEELSVECALVDTLINRWSAEQAVAVVAQIKGLTQEEAAGKIGISQPAVRQRLKAAGWWALEQMLDRYECLIRDAMNGDNKKDGDPTS